MAQPIGEDAFGLLALTLAGCGLQSTDDDQEDEVDCRPKCPRAAHDGGYGGGSTGGSGGGSTGGSGVATGALAAFTGGSGGDSERLRRWIDGHKGSRGGGLA